MTPHRPLRLAGTVVPAVQHPAPTYPEYAQLLADATAAAAVSRHIDPVALRKVMNLYRGPDWKVSVLGYFGDGTATQLEMYLLLLAAERDLRPPLPQWLVERRAAEAADDAAKHAARKARDAADMAAWGKILAGCVVEVVVRRNGLARARYGYLHNLGHVVPVHDAESGMGRKRRRHLAGRAVCESEHRARPLDLSGGEGGPATCDRCLKYTPQLQPAGDPR